MQKTIPYWEKARSTVSNEFGEKNLDKLLKDLEKLRTVNNI